MPRKIFNFDNKLESKIITPGEKSSQYENSISACGCLFYRIYNAKLQLLLISYLDPKRPRFDDLGGKVDESDSDVNDTISREISEETNGVITYEFMQTHLHHNSTTTNIFYNKSSKYYVVVLQVDETFHPDTSVFGDFEETDRIHRVINWMDFKCAKRRLASRIVSNADLMKYLYGCV